MKINTLKITILSISLATVTSGAAVAPALGIFAKHFYEYPELMVKLIISLPSVVIIFSSIIFAKVTKYFDAKTLAIIGFSFFIIGGIMPFFLQNLYIILFFRGILGFGVGFLTPLSVSLIGFMFEKSEQSKLMGLSGMCNQLGAFITVSFSGFLASISWQYSFLIYLFALLIFILVLVFLPKVKLSQKVQKFDKRNFKVVFSFIACVCIMQVLFFAFTNNFAIVYVDIIKPSLVGVVMAINGLCGAICSLYYPKIIKTFKAKTKYIGGFFYLLAFGLFSLRFNSWYSINGISLELICGILAAVCNGIATGTLMPLLISQISLKSKKANLSANMAICSVALYSGQFVSPIIDAICVKIFDLNHPKDAFLIAFFIAILFLAYSSRLKLKLK